MLKTVVRYNDINRFAGNIIYVVMNYDRDIESFVFLRYFLVTGLIDLYTNLVTCGKLAKNSSVTATEIQ